MILSSKPCLPQGMSSICDFSMVFFMGSGNPVDLGCRLVLTIFVALNGNVDKVAKWKYWLSQVISMYNMECGWFNINTTPVLVLSFIKCPYSIYPRLIITKCTTTNPNTCGLPFKRL